MYVEEIIRWVTQSHAFHITRRTYGLTSPARFPVRLRLNQHLSSIDADISNTQTETYQNPSKLPISSWPRKALPDPHWTVVRIMSWFIHHPFRDCSLAINQSYRVALKSIPNMAHMGYDITCSGSDRLRWLLTDSLCTHAYADNKHISVFTHTHTHTHTYILHCCLMVSCHRDNFVYCEFLVYF